ncbi:MAG: hypothetical protein JNL47_05165 [Bacteroidia bacterium]|nr:hypothetical protein [Bacteroidia bacterium]
MEEQVLFDKEFLLISHEKENRLIHLRWKRFATTEEFREGLNAGLKFVMEFKIERWLANLKNMSVIKDADRSWTNEEWFPQLYKTNLKKMAIVHSQDVFNNLAVSKIMSEAKAERFFTVAYFHDVDEARHWLTED